MNVLSKLVVYAGISLLVAGAQAQSNNVHGVLRVVKGDVQVKSGNGETAKARIGAKVFPKDVVITGKDARAKIVMVDNNEINVSPESQVEIQHYEFDPAGGKKDVLLNVIYGKVRSKVEQKYDGKTSKFQIKTPGAVAGVRGTDFMVGFNRQSQSSQVVTFHGKVEFGVPGPGGTIASAVFVTPGMTAASSAGAAPSTPAPMPKEELAKMDKDSNAETPKGAPNSPSNEQRTPAEEKKEGGQKEGAKDSGPKDGSKNDGAKNDGGNKGNGPNGGNGSANGGTAAGPAGGDGSASGNVAGSPGAGGEKGRSPAAASGEAPKTDCTMCGAPPPPPPPPPIATGPVIIKPPEVPRPPTDDQRVIGNIKGGGTTNLTVRVK